MTLALRLCAACMMFGGMLVWWAMAAVVLMAGWLMVAGSMSVAAVVCRRTGRLGCSKARVPRRVGG